MSLLPKPVRWMTYPRDISAEVVGNVMGPTTTMEFVTAVDVVYDSASDTTRVGFCYGAIVPRLEEEEVPRVRRKESHRLKKGQHL